MVRCSDAKFAAFWNKKSFKKREYEAPKEAKAIFEVEAIPTIPILKMAVAEALDVPPEVSGGTKIVGEPVEMHDTLEVPEMAEAPAGGGFPLWAAKAS